MKARPILFSAQMIRTLLAGRKTQTRRIVKLRRKLAAQYAYCDPFTMPPAVWWWNGEHDRVGVRQECPYGQPGALLWVKESWARRLDEDHLRAADIEPARRYAWYWADGPGRTCRTGCAGAAGRVRAALFMPRWASRLTLRLTDVRVERVQEISEDDAEAEGVEPALAGHEIKTYRTGFVGAWRSINGPDSWADNPWVWALTFKVIQKNVNEILAEAA